MLGIGGKDAQGLDATAIVAPRACAQPIRDVLRAHNLLDRSRRTEPFDGDTRVAIPVLPGLPCPIVHSWLAAYAPPSLLLVGVEALHSDSLPLKIGVTAPTVVLRNAVLAFVRDNGGDAVALAGDVPHAWERHGDLALFAPSAFVAPWWHVADRPAALWECVRHALGVKRLARKICISGPRREARVDLLLGTDGWVCHVDNRIFQWFDVTRCMFSSGNISEKLRVAALPCQGETVVDLYAGIGYFTLPYLVHAGAAHVFACEWNDAAADALRRNVLANGVALRCTILDGDNAIMAPVNVADRVNLGLIPSSRRGWPVAARALKLAVGGWLHVHENVTCAAGESWAEAAASVAAGLCVDLRVLLADLTGLSETRCHAADVWAVCVRHTECVKSYAPRIFHVVFDVECRPIQ